MFLSLFVALASIALGGHYSRFWTIPTRRDTQRWECHPFLPKLLVDDPPSPDHTILANAGRNLDYHLAAVFARQSIDSLSVAVVTPGGAIYEKSLGVVRGNETDSELTTSDSVYRIASVAKIFPVFEALLLEQKGALSWDDPIDKYIPEFTYHLDGFNSSSSYVPPDPSSVPITLRDLATHLSGLGRDWPPGTVSEFPHNLRGAGPPPTNGLPFPTHEDVLKAAQTYKLTSPPGKVPAYSNTGTSLLSRAVVIANQKHGGRGEPDTVAKLLKRDIFIPLGMNSSGFEVTEENKARIVVPSLAPEVVDQDFLDAMNPAAGQYSSLSDLIKFTQSILAPNRPLSLLSERTLDKWYKPVHAFDEDDWTEMGLMWEIIKARDSYGRPRRIFWKLGAMAGHHAALAIHPSSGYGVIVLLAGHYPDAAKVAYDIFGVVQPAIDLLLSEMAQNLYAGNWSSSGNTAVVNVRRGTLWLDKYVLDGSDVLRLFGASEGKGLALRPSGRRDEFRIDTGIPGYNGMEHMGCYPYWNGQDLWGVKNGAAVNVVVFEGEGGDRTMRVPSTGAVLMRQ